MTLWTRISEALSALASGESLTQIFDRLRTPPQRSVAFAIAVIALGAKMAKADGVVTRDEVTAFRDVFQIAKEDEAGAAKVFNLARQDVAGFEDYARRISTMFKDEAHTLCDLMEGLFHIAVADGVYHPNEDVFLTQVADIFGIPKAEFSTMRSRFVPDATPDPFAVLGVDAGAPMADVRRAWRKLVQEMHPDRMMARGVPPEAIRLAEKRLIDINRAWDKIKESAAHEDRHV